MVSYQVEKFDDVIEEMKPLLFAHWEEIAGHKEIRKLDPDYDRYRELGQTGSMQMATVRKGKDGELIGYSVDFIVPHLHYKNCLMAYNDIIFLKAEYRKGLTAFKLIKFVKSELKKRGVVLHQISMKRKHDFGRLLERLGDTETEIIFEGVLRG